MKYPLISVIVPVYNVEKTIDRCIKSILEQNYPNIEIILVDDGSTDNSGKMCDDYAHNYSNVRVFHKQNEGLGPTRNLGIKEAKGEYIYHCDSDDWIDKDLLRCSYEYILETDADFVVFGYQMFTQKGEDIIPYKSVKLDRKVLETKIEIRKEFVKHYFDSFVMMSACNRLYKTSFILENDLLFPDLRRSQDMAYSFLLFEKAKKIALLDKEFYCYIIQPGVFKGRSYSEMIEIYYGIYESAKKVFLNWGLLDNDVNHKLCAYVCENVANYSAYAFAVKYKKDWKKNTKILCTDSRLRELFLAYSNGKKSKFMALFKLGIKLKSKMILKFVSSLVCNKEK